MRWAYLLLILYSAFCCFSPEATTERWSCGGHGEGMLPPSGSPPKQGPPFGTRLWCLDQKSPPKVSPRVMLPPWWPRNALGATRPGREFRCTPDPDLSLKNLWGAPGQQDGAEPGSPPYRKRCLSPALKQTQIHFCLLRVGHQPPPLGDPLPGGGNLIPVPSRAHPGPRQPLDGLGLSVADEVVVQGDVGLEPQRLLLGGLQQEVGAAVGLVGAAEAWGPLRGRLGREGIGEKAGKSGLGAMGSPLPALPVPPGSGTAPRRHPGSAGGWHWGAAGGSPFGPPLTPAASCIWPRSSSPSGYWGLLGREEITQSPTSPAPTSSASVLGDFP